MRIGAKQRPFYRVVAVDERSKRNGAYVELLGTYNPLTEPKEIKLNQARIDHWLKQGAQLSDGFLRIIGKAPQRPARKPKKAASVKDSGEPMEKKEATSVEETPTEETVKSSEPEVENVIASGAKQSNTEEESTDMEKIATEPEAPRNDESKEDERPT